MLFGIYKVSIYIGFRDIVFLSLFLGNVMENLAQQLEEKEKQLNVMKKNKSDSFCVNEHGSSSNMQFEMKLEELEDEVSDLKKKIKGLS